MGSQINNYQCPACTGPLHYAGASGKLECEYCGSSFDVSEIEKMNAEKEEKAKQAYEDAAATGNGWSRSSDGWGESSDKLKAYSCPSCGAELICDDTTAATSCPYCGNNTIVPGQFESTSMKPDLIIPFKLDKQRAIEGLQKHYKGKKLLPKSFISSNKVEDITGVYVPFWLFDGSASADVDYRAEKKRSEKHGDNEDIYTEHYEVHRAGRTSFEKVPVDASSKMPSKHMDSIEPYDYKELKDFSTAYLPGYMADKYDIDIETSAPRADLRFENTMLNDLKETVTGYNSVSEVNKHVDLKRGDVKYALFPVWMLSTKFKDQTYTFAMNGQTGKMVGDLPVDKGQLAKYFFAFFIPLIIIMSLLSYAMSDTGSVNVASVILVPLVVSAIVCFVLYSQMKSVATAVTAKLYEKEGAFELSSKSDVYTHTTVEHIHHRQDGPKN